MTINTVQVMYVLKHFPSILDKILDKLFLANFKSELFGHYRELQPLVFGPWQFPSVEHEHFLLLGKSFSRWREVKITEMKTGGQHDNVLQEQASSVSHYIAILGETKTTYFSCCKSFESHI